MGWNGSEKKRVEIEGQGHPRNVVSRSATQRFSSKALIAGIVVVASGFAAWFVIIGRTGRSTSSAPAHHQAPATNAARQIVAVTPAVVSTNRAEVEAKSSDPSILKTVGPHKIVEVVKVVTNADFNQIVETVRTVDGKIGEVVRQARPSVFKHGTDLLLAMTLCHSSRVATAPLPGMRGGNTHDQDFYESIKDPIFIHETDTEAEKEQKRTVREARIKIKDLMDQGYHFDEILDDYERIASENREIRNKAMRELKEIHASGDKDSETQYLNKINAAFETMGIDPLDKPREKKEK